MSKLYYLKYFDDTIGTIEYPSCIFKLSDTYNKPFPASLFAGNKNPKPEQVEKFLKGQVIEENNDSIAIVMNYFNFREYNLGILIDATCCMTLDNAFWVIPKEKLHWKYDTHHIKANPTLWLDTINPDGTITKAKIVDATDIHDID